MRMCERSSSGMCALMSSNSTFGSRSANGRFLPPHLACEVLCLGRQTQIVEIEQRFGRIGEGHCAFGCGLETRLRAAKSMHNQERRGFIRTDLTKRGIYVAHPR